MEIFREVRRVMRDDAVCWLNYGDSYFGDSPVRTSGDEAFSKTWDKSQTASRGGNRRSAARRAGFRPGSLTMMPHRVAIALAEDGWIVRQDLVWYKRNPMPESINGTRWVKHRIKIDREEADWDERPKGWQAGLGGHDTGSDSKGQYRNDDGQTVPKYVDCPGCEKCIPNDGLVLKRGSWRHTRAHEYVFQLVKGPKMKYWSNQEAVREGVKPESLKRNEYKWTGEGQRDYPGQAQLRDREDGLNTTNPAGRNPRSVLDVPTQPYKGSHYATFPVNLIAPLIRATCPRRCCPVCGQGWAAVVEKGKEIPADISSDLAHSFGGSSSVATGGKNMRVGGNVTKWLNEHPNQVLGYRPTCEHDEEAVPGICFDPFVGSGTTVKVAQDLLRRGIGIDISMEYLDLQAKVRIGQGSPSNVLDDLPLFQ